MAQEDIIHNNLKAFLQRLESEQIININEIEKDSAKMQRLIGEIMQLDFQNFTQPDFMQREMQAAVKKPPARSASDGDKAKNFSSGMDSEAHARNGKHTYNTSGHINIGKMKMSQTSTAPDTDHRSSVQRAGSQKYTNHQQYFSGSNAPQSQASNSVWGHHS